MFQKKHLSIVIFVVLCIACVRAEEQKLKTVRTRIPKTGEIVTKQVPVAPKADPYENTSVLVEAFVVEIPAQALAEAGVNPIGQAPEGVSILKILWCLKDGDHGEVISGSKLMARHDSRAEMSNRDTFYVKTENVVHRGPEKVTDVRFDSYQSGLEFEVTPTVFEKSIRVYYQYSQTFVEESEDEAAPPDQCSYDWVGNITVGSGQPAIAGAVQSEDAVTFLILTATVQECQDQN